jgi:FMN phosphatase YigB (HAD superfamily)
MIRSVVFDIGETVLDNTREYGAWADWLGVPRHTFSAVMGAVRSHDPDADVCGYFRPGFDVAVERARREAAGKGQHIDAEDLYPDVVPALTALRERGLWVALAGNQAAQVGTLLRALDLPADAIATSDEWGVRKPHREFFDRVVDLYPGAQRSEVLYVGDHRDFDLLPAHAAGLRTALIRRGPWGHLWADDPAVVDTADWVIRTLDELPDLVRPPR